MRRVEVVEEVFGGLLAGRQVEVGEGGAELDEWLILGVGTDVGAELAHFAGIHGLGIGPKQFVGVREPRHGGISLSRNRGEGGGVEKRTTHAPTIAARRVQPCQLTSSYTTWWLTCSPPGPTSVIVTSRYWSWLHGNRCSSVRSFCVPAFAFGNRM
jgi:hypothetical protein